MSKFSVAAIFSDHMVFQRNKEILIFGTYDGEAEIIVRFDHEEVKTHAVEGTWQVALSKRDAGGPYQLTIQCEEERLTFLDILIGEVWLAGGQSNMELPLIDSKDGKQYRKRIRNDKIRFYQTPRISYVGESFDQAERDSTWEVATSEVIATWSAVGTHFANFLQAELEIPVGIIGCNWGGTSATAWVPKEMIDQEEEFTAYNEDYDKAMAGKTLEQYLEELSEYQESYAAWKKKADALYEKDPTMLWSEVQRIAGPCRWPEPLGPRSPFRVGGLYQTMLARVCPYTIGGFIYYQGESDGHRPNLYSKLLKTLIQKWRTDWRDEELPFIFVQLPMYIGKEDPDTGEWATLREQQTKVSEEVANTWMAVILEHGTFDNIHPLEKKVVGERLAKLALAHVYHKDMDACGPTVSRCEVLGNRIRIYFDHIGEGIRFQEDHAYQESRSNYVPAEPSKTVISLSGFEIAGEDGVYENAELVVAKDSVTLLADRVTTPCFVRYAWHNFSPVTIFNSYGMPLAPFQKFF